MEESKCYYIDMTFDRVERVYAVANKKELMEFLHALYVMMEKEDHVRVYYYEQVKQLNGKTSLQRMIVLDEPYSLFTETMKSY